MSHSVYHNSRRMRQIPCCFNAISEIITCHNQIYGSVVTFDISHGFGKAVMELIKKSLKVQNEF